VLEVIYPEVYSNQSNGSGGREGWSIKGGRIEY